MVYSLKSGTEERDRLIPLEAEGAGIVRFPASVSRRPLDPNALVFRWELVLPLFRPLRVVAGVERRDPPGFAVVAHTGRLLTDRNLLLRLPTLLLGLLELLARLRRPQDHQESLIVEREVVRPPRHTIEAICRDVQQGCGGPISECGTGRGRLDR
jgi:hypothetical protein